MRSLTACFKGNTLRPLSIAIICAAFPAVAIVPLNAQQTTPPVLAAMKAELDRSQEKLKTQPIPPYFLSYEITETHSVNVSGAFGKITGSGENRNRQLDIDLRVGDHTLDNTHEIRGQFGGNNYSTAAIPLDNDPDAIRAVLWYHTDERYKHALEQLTKIKTNVKVKVAQEDQSADFSTEESQHFTEAPVDIQVNRPLWEE